MNEAMRLSEAGRIVEECWKDILHHFTNVELDAFAIVPDHMHGIIILHESKNDICRGEVTSPLPKPLLGQIVAYFKYQSTKHINELHGTPGKRVWQRNYYEHIIRGENDLNNIREYIQANPLQWAAEHAYDVPEKMSFINNIRRGDSRITRSDTEHRRFAMDKKQTTQGSNSPGHE